MTLTSYSRPTAQHGRAVDTRFYLPSKMEDLEMSEATTSTDADSEPTIKRFYGTGDSEGVNYEVNTETGECNRF